MPHTRDAIVTSMAITTALSPIVCPYLALACPVLSLLTVFQKCRPSVPFGGLTTATAFVPTPSNRDSGKAGLLAAARSWTMPRRLDCGPQFCRRHRRELGGCTSSPNTPSRTARVVPPFECYFTPQPSKIFQSLLSRMQQHYFLAHPTLSPPSWVGGASCRNSYFPKSSLRRGYLRI